MLLKVQAPPSSDPIPLPPNPPSKIPSSRRALKKGILNGAFALRERVADPSKPSLLLKDSPRNNPPSKAPPPLPLPEEKNRKHNHKNANHKKDPQASSLPASSSDDTSSSSSPTLSPEVWGPPFWDALFFLSSSPSCDSFFPPLLSSLENCLPCRGCRRSCAVHVRSLDPSLSTNDPVEWIWRLKQLVQTDLGRQSLPLDQVRRRRVALSPPSDFLLLDVIVFVSLSRPSQLSSFLSPLLSLLSPLRPSSPLLSLASLLPKLGGKENEKDETKTKTKDEDEDEDEDEGGDGPAQDEVPSPDLDKEEEVLSRLYSVRLRLCEREGLLPPSRNDFEDQYSVAFED